MFITNFIHHMYNVGLQYQTKWPFKCISIIWITMDFYFPGHYKEEMAIQGSCNQPRHFIMPFCTYYRMQPTNTLYRIRFYSYYKSKNDWETKLLKIIDFLGFIAPNEVLFRKFQRTQQVVVMMTPKPFLLTAFNFSLFAKWLNPQKSKT